MKLWDYVLSSLAWSNFPANLANHVSVTAYGVMTGINTGIDASGVPVFTTQCHQGEATTRVPTSKGHNTGLALYRERDQAAESLQTLWQDRLRLL